LSNVDISKEFQVQYQAYRMRAAFCAIHIVAVHCITPRHDNSHQCTFGVLV